MEKLENRVIFYIQFKEYLIKKNSLDQIELIDDILKELNVKLRKQKLNKINENSL